MGQRIKLVGPILRNEAIRGLILLLVVVVIAVLMGLWIKHVLGLINSTFLLDGLRILHNMS